MNDGVRILAEAFRDRIKNPIIPAFLISFFAWHWKSLLILFCDDAAISKRVARFNETHPCWNSLLVPLGMAAILVFVLPWVAVVIQQYTEAPLRRARQRKIDFETELIDRELVVAQKRQKLFELDEQVRLDSRLRDIESQLDRLQATQPESTPDGQEDFFEGRDETTVHNAINKLTKLSGVTAPLARKLIENGIATLDQLAAIDQHTQVKLRETIPTITPLVERAKEQASR